MPRDRHQEIKRLIIPTLRKASYRWYARTEAIQNATPERGYRTCAGCRGKFYYKDTNVDHIVPVIDVMGFQNWDVYIDRMFCDVSNWQILCKDCHAQKTFTEGQMRKHFKKQQKRKVKDETTENSRSRSTSRSANRSRASNKSKSTKRPSAKRS